MATAESPVAGVGLFATADIVRGTVLGAYPGRPRTEQDMRRKAARAPRVAQYVFSTGTLLVVQERVINGVSLPIRCCVPTSLPVIRDPSHGRLPLGMDRPPSHDILPRWMDLSDARS